MLAKPFLMIKSWQKSTIGSWWSPHPGRLRCASVCETLGVATPGWSMWFPDWWKVGLASQTMKIEQLENGGWDVENLEIWGNYMFVFHLSHSGSTFRSFWGLLEGFNHIWDGPQWQIFLFRQLEPGTFQCVMLPEKGLHQTCRSPIALKEETVMFDGWKTWHLGFSCTSIHKSSIFTRFNRIFHHKPSSWIQLLGTPIWRNPHSEVAGKGHWWAKLFRTTFATAFRGLGFEKALGMRPQKL